MVFACLVLVCTIYNMKDNYQMLNERPYTSPESSFNSQLYIPNLRNLGKSARATLRRADYLESRQSVAPGRL